MAFTTITKTLKTAKPTVRVSDGVVQKWEIQVVYTNQGDGWNRTYPHTESDLEYLGLKPDQYTSAQLISFMSPTMDTVFEHHWEAYNIPPTNQVISDFDITSLGTANTSTN